MKKKRLKLVVKVALREGERVCVLIGSRVDKQRFEVGVGDQDLSCL